MKVIEGERGKIGTPQLLFLWGGEGCSGSVRLCKFIPPFIPIFSSLSVFFYYHYFRFRRISSMCDVIVLLDFFPHWQVSPICHLLFFFSSKFFRRLFVAVKWLNYFSSYFVRTNFINSFLSINVTAPPSMKVFKISPRLFKGLIYIYEASIAWESGHLGFCLDNILLVTLTNFHRYVF